MVDPKKESSAFKQKLLLERSDLGIPSEEFNYELPKDEVPHIGHEGRRLGLTYGYSKKLESYFKASLRYTLHDLLDPTPGFPGYAQMEIFNLNLRYNLKPKTFWVDDFALVRVYSFSPISRFEKPMSWKANFGGRTLQDKNCDGCFVGNVLLGAGYTLGPVVFLIEGEEQISPKLDRFFMRTGAGPSVTLRVPYTPRLIQLSYGTFKFYIPSGKPALSYEHSHQLRWEFIKNLASDLKWTRKPLSWESEFSLMFYF